MSATEWTKPSFQQLRDDCFAKTFNVHDAARGEVKDAAPDACRAGRVDAAMVGFARCALHLRTADGTLLREGEALGAAWMILVGRDLDYFWDHVAATLHAHKVAREAARAAQSRPHVWSVARADGDAADRDRREHGDGREFTGAPDLYLDVEDLRDRETCRELVSDGPSRRLTGKAQPLLQRC